MVYTNAINLYFPHSKDLLQPQQRDFYDRTAHCRSNKIWFQGCSQNESTKKPVKKHPIAFPTRLVIVAGRQNACFYTPWPFFLVYNEKERKKKKGNATFSNLDRTDRRDYPEDAIRESLLNSIVHRDYSFSGSNLVNVYEDRIEFVSLGGLVSGLELESMPFRFSSQS